MDRLDDLIAEAERLLGWHKTKAMRDLAISFPDRRDWEYAVGTLRDLRQRSYPYLVKCLETSCERRGENPRVPPPYRRPKDHKEECTCERCWLFINPGF
jgi:hypothetical protein